jgi:hypothetical protein
MDISSELKNAIYQDKVYSALQILGAREKQSDMSIITDLRTSELRIFSQNGEDGVINAIVRSIPDIPKYFVEFGVGDGWSCNCRLLAEVFGWSGLFLEANSKDFTSLNTRYINSSSIQCKCSFVTPSNINEIFSENRVPSRFGVLSIDIDGQDYWAWNALDKYWQPDIVCIEINAGHGKQVVVEEKSDISNSAWTNTWGASISAIMSLGESKGYTAVHTEMAGVNIFLVRNEILLKNKLNLMGIIERSPNYGLRGRGHPHDVLFPNGENTDRPLFQLDKSKDDRQ